MPNTLKADLRGLALLYGWGDKYFDRPLDDVLGNCTALTANQMDACIAFLRQGGQRGQLRAMSTVGRDASAIASFLCWAVDPANQGRQLPKLFSQISEERLRIVECFKPVIRTHTSTNRIRPLDAEEVARIEEMFGPRTRDGVISQPLSFSNTNPFRPASRIRNWLLMCIALHCGLRRGELLKLQLSDLPRGGDGLLVRRRSGDPADSRRHEPGVKTVERVVVISPIVRVLIRAYISAGSPLGRRSGRSPYLFTSTHGDPLSIAAADDIVQIVSKYTGIPDLSWHTFRHTWAENLAEDLLAERSEEDALALLRELGGWKPRSSTPMHYIRNALVKRANGFLRERNTRLYGRAED